MLSQSHKNQNLNNISKSTNSSPLSKTTNTNTIKQEKEISYEKKLEVYNSINEKRITLLKVIYDDYKQSNSRKSYFCSFTNNTTNDKLIMNSIFTESNKKGITKIKSTAGYKTNHNNKKSIIGINTSTNSSSTSTNISTNYKNKIENSNLTSNSFNYKYEKKSSFPEFQIFSNDKYFTIKLESPEYKNKIQKKEKFEGNSMENRRKTEKSSYLDLFIKKERHSSSPIKNQEKINKNGYSDDNSLLSNSLNCLFNISKLSTRNKKTVNKQEPYLQSNVCEVPQSNHKQYSNFMCSFDSIVSQIIKSNTHSPSITRASLSFKTTIPSLKMNNKSIISNEDNINSFIDYHTSRLNEKSDNSLFKLIPCGINVENKK